MKTERERFEIEMEKLIGKVLSIEYSEDEGGYIAHKLMLSDESTKILVNIFNISWYMWQAAKADAVPDGFVVVPKELSAKMVDKLADVICDTFDTTIKGSENCAREAYKAMISAGETK